MSFLSIENVLFSTDNDNPDDGIYTIRVAFCDSGSYEKETDLIIKRDILLENGDINTHLMYIQGITNILALKKYIDHVIDLHDRDLIQ